MRQFNELFAVVIEWVKFLTCDVFYGFGCCQDVLSSVFPFLGMPERCLAGVHFNDGLIQLVKFVSRIVSWCMDIVNEQAERTAECIVQRDMEKHSTVYDVLCVGERMGNLKIVIVVAVEDGLPLFIRKVICECICFFGCLSSFNGLNSCVDLV